MNINTVQYNNNQSFGMSFKLKGNGAEKIAKSFSNCKNVENAEKYFMDYIAKPIQKLKSEVIYDGEKVFVKAHNSEKTIEVLDDGLNGHIPWVSSDFRSINFNIKSDDAYAYSVLYGEPQNKVDGIINILELSSGDELKLICAREIAKDMDAVAAKKAYEIQSETAKEMFIKEKTQQLQELFA